MNTKVCKKSPVENHDGIQFAFANGETREVMIHQFPLEMQRMFTYNGMSQKLGDVYANSDTVAEAVEKFDRLYEALMEGNWSVKRNATGGLLAEALAALTDSDIGEVRERIAKWDDKRKKAAAADKRVAAMMAQIKAEKLAKAAEDASDAEGMDLDTLFE